MGCRSHQRGHTQCHQIDSLLVQVAKLRTILHQKISPYERHSDSNRHSCRVGSAWSADGSERWLGSACSRYSGPHNDTARFGLAAAFAVASLAAVIALGFRHWRWRASAAYLVLFTALLAWYFTIKPSNERDWQTDVAVLPYATIEDNLVTVHNIRNFDYRSETDYTPAWYDKRFDLNKLEGVDLIAIYWMGPDIAHVI